MEDKKPKIFADGIYAFKTDFDWMPFKLQIVAKEFAETLIKHADLAAKNDGKLNIDCKVSGKGKLYLEINDFVRQKEVTKSDYSPDRQEADLPI
jgi:hypothetical protein